MPPPRYVRTGDDLRAADHNSVVDALRGGLRGGRGIKGLFGAVGIVELLRNPQMVLIPARVTAAPAAMEIEEPDCTYTIRAIPNPNWVLDGHRPGYRLFEGPGILMRPAPVGSFCWMVREFAGGGRYDVDAIVLKEKFLTTMCPDPPPAVVRPAPTREELVLAAIKGQGGGAVGGVAISPAPVPPPSGGIA
jgi:hypothetical protein